MDSTKVEIKEASIDSSKASEEFEYENIRLFQKESINWYKDKDSEPILVLQAPTGSGKTAVFSDILKRNRKSLVIYPTNSLLHQQKRILDRIDGLNPQIISSNILDKRQNRNRADSLQEIVDRPKNDVLLTNPDILQAILQGQYIDPTDKLVRRFFEYMDTIIYDEFHFYDEFETSGIALQLKVLSERLQREDANPNIILSSATPNQDYLDYIRDDMDIDIKKVRGRPTEDANSIFRRRTNLEFRKNSINQDQEFIIDKLKQSIEEADDLSNPAVAVIFNSAKESNRFQSYLKHNHSKIASNTKKDNGYDTYSDEEETEDYYILNTTSKGEVGLNFDIRELYMECPYTAPSFIQRIGRAGRKSEAQVYAFNIEIASPPSTEIRYKDFVDYIYREIRTPQMNSYRIKNLMGLRAAVAVYQRETDKGYNREIYSDFTDIEMFPKWKKFIENSETKDGKWITPSENASQIIEYIQECINNVLSTLRGSNLSVKVTYPIGQENKGTEYDIVTAVAHYNVKEVNYETGEIKLGKQRERPNVEISLKHFGDLRESFYDYRWSELSTDYIDKKVYNSNIENVTDMEASTITEFFELLGVNAKIGGKIHIPNKEYSPIELQRMKN